MASYNPANILQILQQVVDQQNETLAQLGQINARLDRDEVLINAQFDNLKILAHNQRAVTGSGLEVRSLLKIVSTKFFFLHLYADFSLLGCR